MKLVRILNVLHYDQRKQRFTSLAFTFCVNIE
jgi:hypothetical protein